MTRYLFFSFGRESMFAMDLSSNNMVTNLGKVASVLMILVPELQWTQTNCSHTLRMSFASSLFIMTFAVDWLSISIQHVLTDFTDPWVSLPLFSHECLSVPPRIQLSIPVMSASIVSSLLIFPRLLARTDQNPPHLCRCLPLLS